MQRGRPMGVLYTFRSVKERTKALFWWVVYKHIGVGFGVARSTVMGNATASNRGTSGKDSHTFLYLCLHSFPHLFILRPLGAGRLIANTMHVGKLIEQELKRQQRSQAWLARALNCSPANVCKIISRQYIDTDTLARICKALNHNFFDDIAKSL